MPNEKDSKHCKFHGSSKTSKKNDEMIAIDHLLVRIMLYILIMFARYLKNLTRALPLALAFGLNMLSYRQIQLATPPIVNQTRIKFISDIG